MTQQGIENPTDEEATELVGRDRESSQSDLLNAIDNGDFPRWNLKIQVIPEKDVGSCHLNPFDLTKVWPHADYPLIDVGVLELSHNAEN